MSIEHLLLGIADFVLENHPECTQEHVKVSVENGLITFDVDAQGYYPCVTDKYNQFTELVYGRIE